MTPYRIYRMRPQTRRHWNGGATVWDYIGAVLFLASDEAAYISGDIMTIDGGAVSRR